MTQRTQLALISMATAIFVALITTWGTINASENKLGKLQGDVEELSGQAGITLSKHAASVQNKGERHVDLGEHRYCALSAIRGPGGFDTVCRLEEKSGRWTLHATDKSSAESHGCEAVCF